MPKPKRTIRDHRGWPLCRICGLAVPCEDEELWEHPSCTRGRKERDQYFKEFKQRRKEEAQHG